MLLRVVCKAQVRKLITDGDIVEVRAIPRLQLTGLLSEGGDPGSRRNELKIRHHDAEERIFADLLA